MRLIKIPKKSLGENIGWSSAMVLVKSILTDYELQERVDYNCYYMSGVQELHILLNDGKENVASMLALRFMYEV